MKVEIKNARVGLDAEGSPRATISVVYSDEVKLGRFGTTAEVMHQIRCDRINNRMNPEVLKAFWAEVERIAEEDAHAKG